MKKTDIRNIYVCEILKQSKVEEHDDYYWGTSYTWGYEKDSTMGLFVRALGGYKHILTDTIYPKPSNKTGNKYVINPDNMEKLTTHQRELCSHIINENKSFYIDSDTIKYLEDRINNEKNLENQEEITTSYTILD